MSRCENSQEESTGWVGIVPYSHAVNKTRGYPTDCSGYVDWVTEVGKDIKVLRGSATIARPSMLASCASGTSLLTSWNVLQLCDTVPLRGRPCSFLISGTVRKTHFGHTKVLRRPTRHLAALMVPHHANHYVKRVEEIYEMGKIMQDLDSWYCEVPRRIIPSILCPPSDRGATSVVV